MIRATLTTDDTASVRLRQIAAQLARPEALYKDAGRRVATDLRKHFTQLDKTRANRLAPGRRSHVWLEIRNAVGNPEPEPGGVSVTIADPRYTMKLFGGTVRPKRARALTIPLHPLAYDRRASVFEDETGAKLFRPRGKRILMAEIGGKAVPIYALATSATVRPDPDALPAERLRAGALETAEKHLARMLARE